MQEENKMGIFVGIVERFTLDAISGWAIDKESSIPVELELLLNGKPVGTFKANRFRRDLVSLKDDGRCAFAITPLIQKKGLLKFLPRKTVFSIRILGTDKVIKNGEKIFEGERSDDLMDFVNRQGLTYRLNKGVFIIPISERPAKWKANALSLVNKIHDYLLQHDYHFCLAYGTLLGLVRESDFLGHDDDVDCMLIVKASTIIQAVDDFFVAIDLLRSGGFSVDIKSNGQVFLGDKTGTTVDTFLGWFDEDGLKLTFTVINKVPKDSILPIQTSQLHGTHVPVPYNPSLILAAIYGPSWNIPDRSFAWNRPAEIAEYFLPIHNYNRGANLEYWDTYYSKNDDNAPPRYPSQFAIFVQSSGETFDTVVEIGCGTARDSLFFASQGAKVISCDYSEKVITANSLFAKTLKLQDKVSFHKVDFSNLNNVANFKQHISTTANSGRKCFYSRFFFHAIDINTETCVLLFYSDICRYGDIIACEFRVDGDQHGGKTTSEHYRRYIKPLDFINNCHRYGFSPYYYVEGKAYANYKDDDALVVRTLLKRL